MIICRVLLISLLLALPSLARAAVGSSAADTWYLRADCTFNGDGLSYACAASNGAAGAFKAAASSNLIWTATTGIDDGDTLYICGAHSLAVYVGGSATGVANPAITISFNCPSNQGSIRKITNMTEALTGSNWTDEGGNLWYLSVASYTWKNPRRVWVDSVERFPSDTKGHLGAQIGSVGPIATFFYDSATDRLYLYATANPATTMSLFESLVAGSATCDYAAMCLTSAANDYFNIINPNLSGGNLAALYVAGGSAIHVSGTTTDDTSCNIGAYSPRGIVVTDSATDGTGTVSEAFSLTDCTVDPIVPTALRTYGWLWDFGGHGDGIAVHYGVTGATITSNTFRDWNHVHVNLVANVGTLSVTDVVVSLNTMTCVISYCRAFAMDGAADGRNTRNIFRGNTVRGMATRSQFNGNGNEVSNNLFADQRCETVSTAIRCQTLDMEGYTGSVSHHNVILNNRFVNNIYAPCISFRAGTNTKSGFLVQGNRLINCGGTAMVGYEYAAIVVQNAASVGNQDFIDNLIFTGSHASAAVYYKATGLTTVAGFQSACSGDRCVGNVGLTGTVQSNRSVRPQP